MKIALINLSPAPRAFHRQTPLGIAYLSSVVGDIADVSLIDYAAMPEAPSPDQLDADLIGVSVTSNMVNRAIDMARSVKAANPQCQLVCGGPHPTAYPTEMLQGGFDFAVRGEGERAFRLLVEGADLADIANLSWRREGRVTHNDQAPRLNCLDDIPFPSREQLPLELYEHDSLITTRGCGHACYYCSSAKFWGPGVSRRSIPNVVAELAEIRALGRNRNLYICDDAFTSDSGYAERLCLQMADSELGLAWSALARTDQLSPKLLARMHDAGCHTLAFGIENGSERFQHAVKRSSMRTVANAVRDAREAAIRTRTTWIVGVGATLEEEYESIEAMKALQPDQISIHLLVPFPGTPLWNNPERFGLTIDKAGLQWDMLNMTESPDLLDHLTFRHISRREIGELVSRAVFEMEQLGYNSGEGREIESSLDGRTLAI